MKQESSDFAERLVQGFVMLQQAARKTTRTGPIPRGKTVFGEDFFGIVLGYIDTSVAIATFVRGTWNWVRTLLPLETTTVQEWHDMELDDPASRVSVYLKALFLEGQKTPFEDRAGLVFVRDQAVLMSLVERYSNASGALEALAQALGRSYATLSNEDRLFVLALTPTPERQERLDAISDQELWHVCRRPTSRSHAAELASKFAQSVLLESRVPRIDDWNLLMDIAAYFLRARGPVRRLVALYDAGPKTHEGDERRADLMNLQRQHFQDVFSDDESASEILRCTQTCEESLQWLESPESPLLTEEDPNVVVGMLRVTIRTELGRWSEWQIARADRRLAELRHKKIFNFFTHTRVADHRMYSNSSGPKSVDQVIDGLRKELGKRVQ